MTIPAASAANAYASAARAIAQATKTEGAGGADAAGESGFAEMLKSTVENAATSMQKSDAATMAQLTGGTDVVDVVTAVAETEVTLRTLVTVRDRVIAAYQEIMRMPI